MWRSSVLVEGKLGANKDWIVTASHFDAGEESEPLGQRRPCLGVEIREFLGNAFSLRGPTRCYETPGYLSATAEPLFVSTVVTGLSAKSPHEVIAVGLPTAALTLRVEFCDGTHRSLAATTLRQKSARFLGVRRFNYAVLELPEATCIEAWTSLNAAGDVL